MFSFEILTGGKTYFVFLQDIGKFSTIISSSIFSWTFFLSSSGTPMIRMLGHLTLSQRFLRLSSFLLICFSFFLSYISTILSSTSLILCSASIILLFVPSRVFFFNLIYCIILEREMATHSGVLAWRTPGMEEPSGLPSMGSHRVGQD